MSTADATTLSAILVGKLQTWKLESEGGTAITVATPNYIRFAVGKKGISNRQSTSVFVPHMKNTKTLKDIESVVIGNWDADFQTTSKCEYCIAVGASSKGI
ncbi:MAG: hypothetical protein PHQ93_06205 [Sulfurimonas sp.]|uniref:hypothetical protein n=1 Tax=Sulfurimonas sp. TaxID=2022749 RepID=UPI0026301ADE|nr:hypothetical protein [Sulfurimonas sp.]MDD5400758.1 hypothetical protein [Sulfurimonas sp.]